MALNLTTNHHAPWALVRRGGDSVGKRPSTRMAFLVATVVPKGELKAVALTGYVMRNDMTGRSKRPVRIEWSDIVRQWHRQPTPADVRKVKARMPIVRDEASRHHGGALRRDIARAS